MTRRIMLPVMVAFMGIGLGLGIQARRMALLAEHLGSQGVETLAVVAQLDEAGSHPLDVGNPQMPERSYRARFELAYAANGRIYRASFVDIERRYQRGDPVEIVYLPNRPESFMTREELALSRKRDLFRYGAAIGAAFVGIAPLCFLWKRVKNGKA